MNIANLSLKFIFFFFMCSCIALLVKAHWERSIGISELYLSFYRKMSLSLSNLLGFAEIPLTKISINSKQKNWSPISPWRGFFHSMVYIFTIQKISLHWAPLFWTSTVILSKHVFKQIWWKFVGAKYGSYLSQKVQNFMFGGFIEWKTSVYICPLFVLFKLHWPS